MALELFKPFIYSKLESLSSAIMSKKEQVLVIEPPIGLSFICVNFSVCLWNQSFLFRAHLHWPVYERRVLLYEAEKSFRQEGDRPVSNIRQIPQWLKLRSLSYRCASRSRQLLPNAIVWNLIRELLTRRMRFRLPLVSSPSSKTVIWKVFRSFKTPSPRFDPNEKNKHKFMVQSMFAPDGEINQDTLVSWLVWKSS